MRRRSSPPPRRGSEPSTLTVPLVGRMRSTSMRIVVVLPAPFGPRKPTTSPGSTLNERSSTARTAPKRLVRLVHVMAGVTGSSLPSGSISGRDGRPGATGTLGPNTATLRHSWRARPRHVLRTGREGPKGPAHSFRRSGRSRHELHRSAHRRCLDAGVCRHCGLVWERRFRQVGYDDGLDCRVDVDDIRRCLDDLDRPVDDHVVDRHAVVDDRARRRDFERSLADRSRPSSISRSGRRGERVRDRVPPHGGSRPRPVRTRRHARSGEVVVQGTARGPRTTVLVRMLGTDGSWWVLGSATPNIQLSAPAVSATIASPVRLRGSSSAFEATVNVSIRADDRSQPLAEGYVMGGSTQLGPFDATMAFARSPSRFGAIVMYTMSSATGRVAEATVIRVRFAGP